MRSLGSKMISVINTALRMRRRKRLPDLGKLERAPHFRDLDAAATAWIDENFRLLEEDAPWLIPVGQVILDYCIAVTSPRGVMHKGVISVTGQRSVTSAYGFDGSAGSQLDRLSAVLARTGWNNGEWHHPDSVPGLVPPPGRATIRIGWAGRGDPVEPVSSLIMTGPHLEESTDFYRPIQVKHSSAAELISRTLGGHQNVIAIQMTAVYYRA